MKDWIGGTFMVIGMVVGVAFMNIPTVVAITGFYPGILMSVIVWFFVCSVALLYAEETLVTIDGANAITISHSLLGNFWSYIVAIIFAFNLYGFLTAYLIVGTQTVKYFLPHIPLSDWLVILILALIFGGVVYLGISATNKLNFVLCIGLIVSFVGCLFAGKDYILFRRLSLHSHWIFISFSVPVIFSALGFAAFVPSLCSFLKRDPKKIFLSIFLGTLISLVLFILWQMLILGIVSAGVLQMAHEQRISISAYFTAIEKIPYLPLFINFLSFFAVTTSLLISGITLVDFLSDGFKISLAKRTGVRRFLVVLTAFIPPIIFASTIPKLSLSFVNAVTAPIGELLINGLLPIWMAFRARYHYRLVTQPLLGGGKTALIILAVALFFLIYLEAIAWIK